MLKRRIDLFIHCLPYSTNVFIFSILSSQKCKRKLTFLNNFGLQAIPSRNLDISKRFLYRANSNKHLHSVFPISAFTSYEEEKAFRVFLYSLIIVGVELESRLCYRSKTVSHESVTPRDTSRYRDTRL